MNIENTINEARKLLKNKDIKSFDLDCEILMCEVIQQDRKYIALNLRKTLNREHVRYYKDLIDKRLRKIPVAYLVGRKDFWKFEFKVDHNVLIPRPDSELIVEEVLKLSRNKSKLQILEIGVGSGCIILSILKEKKDFYGTGIDISAKCIKMSRQNSLNLNLNNRLKLIKSDVDNFKIGKYDIIISNPPYIKKLDLKYLEKDVIDFEPKLALDGGIDGLSEIRKIVLKSSELIKKNGKLILEIAFDQKEEVKKILTNNGFYVNKVCKDIQSYPRVIITTKTF